MTRDIELASVEELEQMLARKREEQVDRIQAEIDRIRQEADRRKEEIDTEARDKIQPLIAELSKLGGKDDSGPAIGVGDEIIRVLSEAEEPLSASEIRPLLQIQPANLSAQLSSMVRYEKISKYGSGNSTKYGPKEQQED